MRTKRALCIGLGAAFAVSLVSVHYSAREGRMEFAFGPRDAHALFVGKFFKKIGKGFKSLGKGIGKAFKKMGSGIAKGFKNVGKAMGKGLKAVAKGFKTVGRGLWNAAKKVGKGIAWVAKKTWEGVKWVAKKIAAPFKWIYEKVKKFIKNNGPKIAKFLRKTFGSKLMDKIMSIAGKFYPEVEQVYKIIKDALNAAQQIIHYICNPKELVDKGKAWAVNKLTDVAMNALSPLMKKAFGLIIGLAVKLLKHFATTPLAGMIAGAIASVTFGIGAITMPLIKLGIDKLFDFIIDKVKQILANALYGGARGLLKKVVMKPLVNGAYNAIMKFVKSKFPQLFVAGAKVQANVCAR
jgi:hypothetical protein